MYFGEWSIYCVPLIFSKIPLIDKNVENVLYFILSPAPDLGGAFLSTRMEKGRTIPLSAEVTVSAKLDQVAERFCLQPYQPSYCSRPHRLPKPPTDG